VVDDSWFRRKTWTQEDEAAFFSRLRRSRTAFHKAQYCRIQACELQMVGEYRAALGLLELVMREWPEAAQRAAVYHQKAECLEKLGQEAAAIEAYRAAFDAQRKQPTYKTAAHLDFGWLVATRPYPALYDEALRILEEFETPSPFPVEEFRSAAIQAFIWNGKGDRERSRRHAEAALAAMRRTHSGFARHPDLGLVEGVDLNTCEQLERLATGKE